MRYRWLAALTAIGSGALSTFAAPASAVESPTSIIVQPVSASTNDAAWIASAVQHQLIGDLPHASAGGVTTDDSKTIAALAHSSNAGFVIAAQVQRVDDEIRVTAQMYDRDGKVCGHEKQSGDVRDLFDLEDKLSFDLRDSLRTAVRSHQPLTAMPTMESAGRLTVAPQLAQPVGTVAVTYSSRQLREGRDRNIYNTPFYEGYGLGCCGFGGFGYGGFGGFGGFGPAIVGFATGGTGQGAY